MKRSTLALAAVLHLLNAQSVHAIDWSLFKDPDNDTTAPQPPPGIDPKSAAGRDTGLGLVAHWDSGAGFRYLMARRLGLETGIDLAWSEEDFVFYIAVGTGWR